MKDYLGSRDPDRAVAMLDAGVITKEESCDGKVGHPTQAMARAAAKAVFRSTGRKAALYRCRFCGLHHVTRLRRGEDEE